MFAFDKFSTNQLETTIFYVTVFSLWATVGVWLGVFLERERFSERIRDFGWRLLLAALAAETASGFILMGANSTNDNRQKREILALESRVAPRRLSEGQIHGWGFSLSSFSGRAVRVESYSLDGESAVLATQITAALSEAGMVVDDGRMSQNAMGAITFGIHVTGDDKAFVEALVKRLAEIGLSPSKSPPVFGSGLSLGHAPLDRPLGATIFVGIKPITH